MPMICKPMIWIRGGSGSGAELSDSGKAEILMELPPTGLWLTAIAAALLSAACAGPSNPAGPNRTTAGASTVNNNPAVTADDPVADPATPGLSAASTPSGGSSTRSATSCSTDEWGIGAINGATVMSPGPLYLVRVGQHACFDRIVFDLNGSEPVGYVVRYVPVVAADPSGKPVTVAGRAVLQVVVRAPILGKDDEGHQPWRNPPAVGDDLVARARIEGWASVREIAFAGSFEGQTTIAVGVSQQLPFRAFVTAEAGYRHVVVDVAH